MKQTSVGTKILHFFKHETVLIVSFLLAAVSAFFVPPSAAYLDSIDFNTLALLFSLMAVVAGIQNAGWFDRFAVRLSLRFRSYRQLALSLVVLCFFSSALITNDVALISFVPFSVVLLKKLNLTAKLPSLVVLETVAANLGSMLTPVGNPQNLYLFSAYDMRFADLFIAVAPYAALSLLMLILCVLPAKKSGFLPVNPPAAPPQKTDKKFLLFLYPALFILALTAVFRLIPAYVPCIASVVALLIVDRKALLRIDYGLLLTFLLLFIFIGNIGSLPSVSGALSDIVAGNEVLSGVVVSQFCSNVPAAILLSRFTQDATALLVGVNLGGLGTLIASMASLISFRFVLKTDVKPLPYLLRFTLINLLFLACNLGLWWLLKTFA